MKEDVQRVILRKLTEVRGEERASLGLELRDLLEDQDLVKIVEYAPAYERLVRSALRDLIEQGFVQCDEPLEDIQGIIHIPRELSLTAEIGITDDGSALLEHFDKKAEETADRDRPRQIPLERSQAVPSSLVGLLGGELKGEFCLFIGAGASTSAGIPCGKAFREKILCGVYGETSDGTTAEEEFRREFEEQIASQELTLEMMLSLLRQKFGDSAFRVLQREVGKDLEPAPGYYSLAYLIQHGFFKVVFTVNIDELIERALDDEIGRNKYNLICEINRFRSRKPIPAEHLEKPLLVKLHGTSTLESTLIVTVEDVQNLPPEKAKFLDYYASNYPLIFIGYSGRDPDIRAALCESSRKSKNRKIFWVSPNDLEKEARKTLGFYDSSSNHIKVTSNAFFDELEHRLIGGYPHLENEVTLAILSSGPIGMDREQIVQEILRHPSWGHRIHEAYKGRENRLLRDVEVSLQRLIENSHIEYKIKDGRKRYWD